MASATVRRLDQPCETVELFQGVLREAVDHPSQLGASQISDGVGGWIMEASVAWFYRESDIWPGDVEVDPLA